MQLMGARDPFPIHVALLSMVEDHPELNVETNTVQQLKGVDFFGTH